MALIDDVKQACRVTSSAYDSELADLVEAALADMGITDIAPEFLAEASIPPLVKRAVLTYCKMNFGVVDDGYYDRLKASYDEQKSQLIMSRQYRGQE
jgi:hypothetical protein